MKEYTDALIQSRREMLKLKEAYERSIVINNKAFELASTVAKKDTDENSIKYYLECARKAIVNGYYHLLTKEYASIRHSSSHDRAMFANLCNKLGLIDDNSDIKLARNLDFMPIIDVLHNLTFDEWNNNPYVDAIKEYCDAYSISVDNLYQQYMSFMTDADEAESLIGIYIMLAKNDIQAAVELSKEREYADDAIINEICTYILQVLNDEKDGN